MKCWGIKTVSSTWKANHPLHCIVSLRSPVLSYCFCSLDSLGFAHGPCSGSKSQRCPSLQGPGKKDLGSCVPSTGARVTPQSSSPAQVTPTHTPPPARLVQAPPSARPTLSRLQPSQGGPAPSPGRRRRLGGSALRCITWCPAFWACSVARQVGPPPDAGGPGVRGGPGEVGGAQPGAAGACADPAEPWHPSRWP